MERKRLKFIGCEVIYREACYLAATGQHRVDVEFLKKGLHDLETPDMLAKIQSVVDSAGADDDYEAILLGYGRCNDGVVGLQAREIPLVIPRAHDCITLFFGSRSAFQADFDAHPGTYYKTSGWMEREDAWGGQEGYAKPAYGQAGVIANLGMAESYANMVAKYGQENAAFIAETMGDWTKNYTRYLYVKMGLCPEDDYIEQIQEASAEKGWEFDLIEGDLTLLAKLFAGQWDDDFLVVQPGQVIVARNDDTALDCRPA